jgi:hypothetical protein
LHFGLDALDDDFATQADSQEDDGADNRGFVLTESAYEATVDLQCAQR